MACTPKERDPIQVSCDAVSEAAYAVATGTRISRLSAASLACDVPDSSFVVRSAPLSFSLALAGMCSASVRCAFGA
jgi:hypothetical protein